MGHRASGRSCARISKIAPLAATGGSVDTRAPLPLPPNNAPLPLFATSESSSDLRPPFLKPIR